MTKADKTDILNLIANANSLTKVAESATAPYHDEAVAKFAESAIEDARSVNDFVLKVVQGNIQHFIDLTKIRIGGGCWGYQAISRFFDKRLVSVAIGKNLYATLYIDNFVQRKDMTATFDEIYITANADDVEVVSVYNDTSDTSLVYPDWEYKTETIYHVCRSTDLFFKTDSRSFNLSLMYSPKDWKIVKARATWTRAKAALLIYSLKNQLAERIEGLRKIANDNEQTREENQKTATYKKVGL